MCKNIRMCNHSPQLSLCADCFNENRNAELVGVKQQLANALPTWTKITDDPDTWPKQGEIVILYYSDEHAVHCEEWETRHGRIYRGDYYRPLCDLDYPQE